jgi:pyruvate,water dikinase
MVHEQHYLRWLQDVDQTDLAQVGGKASALGSLLAVAAEHGLRVPSGFVITTAAYTDYIQQLGLHDAIEQLYALAAEGVAPELWQEQAGTLRQSILHGTLSPQLSKQISTWYAELGGGAVAVRSSATSEDGAHASSAGQYDTFLYIEGEEALYTAIKACMASLLNDRALSYRTHHTQAGQIAMAICVQKMVAASHAVSGVAFTLDTESGDDRFILITATYGLGEGLVQGSVTPDEFLVHKERLAAGYAPIVHAKLAPKQQAMQQTPAGVKLVSVPDEQARNFCLCPEQVLEVARAALALEQIGRVLWQQQTACFDIEWAYDAEDGKLSILQLRPETVHTKEQAVQHAVYTLTSAEQPTVLAQGIRVGARIAHGQVFKAETLEEALQCEEGAILVTRMTDPDWMPVLRKVRGIVTDLGGRTCHAAIVSRELGIPAVVGTHGASQLLEQGLSVTIDTASHADHGLVYSGHVPFSIEQQEGPGEIARCKTDPAVYITLADPSQAASLSRLPIDGVGIVRLELVIAHEIGVHPRACFQPDALTAPQREILAAKMQGYPSAAAWYQAVLTQAIARIASAFYPRIVTVRLTDLKSNEYRCLLAGEHFEQEEENPMLGWRGAGRYIDPSYAESFALECQALLEVWHTMGLHNIQVMVPFVRTVAEARAVVAVLESYGMGLRKGGPALIMMVEIPSNVLLLEQFAHYFDGFSIGSNDLTQLTLGIDRDAGLRCSDGDERNEAVMQLMLLAVTKARQLGKPISTCGQAPSDFPEVAQALIAHGVTGISLNPDVVIPFLKTRQAVALQATAQIPSMVV